MLSGFVSAFKYFVDLAKKDKGLTLFAVLFALVLGAAYLLWDTSEKNIVKEEKNEVKEAKYESKADKRQQNCDSLVNALYGQIAQLNFLRLEDSKEYNRDMKEQRNKFQELAGEHNSLVQELKLANKRNARKVKELVPDNEIKNEN